MTPDHSYNVKESMRTDRLSLVSELEKVGARFKGNECTCPYHEDNRPSAGVYEDEMGVWRFKCQATGCGFGGDYWDLRARNENKTLAQLFTETEPTKVVYSQTPAPKKAKARYASIDLAAKTFADQIEARYQYTHPTTGQVELVVFRLQTATGKSFRQLSPDGQEWVFQAPPKPWPIYNRRRVLAAETIIVVEGEKCVHELQSYGIVSTTSPCGAGKGAYADWSPLAGKIVMLWPDNDEAGRKHMDEVQTLLQTLNPPPTIKAIDPCELELEAKEDVVDYIQVLVHMGYDRDVIFNDLQSILCKSRSLTVAAEVGERIEKSINGTWSAVELPWTKLEHLSHPLLPGSICLFVGSVGHGKSFLLLECLVDFHRRGYRVACYELEEDRVYHLSRVLAQQAGIPELIDPQWVKSNQELARMKYAEHKTLLESFGQCVWATPEAQQTLPQIADWIAARAGEGCRVIAVDPITAALGTDKPWIADNAFLQRIKRAASDNGCSIILVTHPTKVFIKPDVNSLAGSAAYSRFAQTIFWLIAHKRKTSTVKGVAGTVEMDYERTMMIMKARNGSGGGLSLAFELDRENLCMKELGIVIKESKN